MPRDTRSSTSEQRKQADELTLDLQRASLEQLVERARQLGIVGFEEMTREELVRRIQEVN